MENRTHPLPARILVRGTNWLGDAVMTTPALLRLRETFPDACIVLMAPEKLRDLWRNHPAVNETITFAPGEGVFTVSRRLRRWVEANSRLEQIIGLAGTAAYAGTRTTGFDLALVLPNSPRSALEVWLAGIPRRIGYARPWRNWFLTTRVAPRPEAVKMRKRSGSEIKVLIRGSGVRPGPPARAHQLYEYLHLAAALGASPEPVAPQLFVSRNEIAAVRKKFNLEETERPLLGLNPGAEYGPAKRWPMEKFIAAAREIQKQTNCTWLMFGGPADATIADRIASALASPPNAILNLAGKTSLRELMALLKICRVLLTNDSGPMHVAAALGNPVVATFGSTSPELTGPGLPGDPQHRLLKSDVLCSPCFLRKCPIDFRCMAGISAERVSQAVLSLV
jgi:heptosyltransferase II